MIKNILILIICFVVFNGCYRISPEDYWNKDDLVTFVAISEGEDDVLLTRLVLSEYNNPRKYKYLTPPNIYVETPIFSPDKENISV